MRSLVPGERAGVGDELTLALDAPLRPPLALALIGLDGDRRIPANFGPIDTVRRELRSAARFDEQGVLGLSLASLPASVERLALAAFLTTGPGGGSSMREWGQLEVRTEGLRFPIPLVDRSDTALILVELYRHQGGWRLAANGQGFVHGLPALADAFGGAREWASGLVGRRVRPAGSDRDRPGPGRSDTRETGSGSGVAVDRHHVLTNAHVVEDARAIRVAGEGRTMDAHVVLTDGRNDLALLRLDDPIGCTTRFRDALELHLGEDVVALGFPLQGLLGSGPQASAGNIAALSGIGNDTSVFQFTAPIASGNSGGPILDASGLVIGLVCSSLNIDRIRSAGSSAENVNFGIKGATIRNFLDAFGLAPALDRPGEAISRAAMVRTARADLYRIVASC